MSDRDSLKDDIDALNAKIKNLNTPIELKVDYRASKSTAITFATLAALNAGFLAYHALRDAPKNSQPREAYELVESYVKSSLPSFDENVKTEINTRVRDLAEPVIADTVGKAFEQYQKKGKGLTHAFSSKGISGAMDFSEISKEVEKTPYSTTEGDILLTRSVEYKKSDEMTNIVNDRTDHVALGMFVESLILSALFGVSAYRNHRKIKEFEAQNVPDEDGEQKLLPHLPDNRL